MKFGYARVSSNSQDHAAQVEALQAAGCQRILSEKASGKSTNGRPEFTKLMKALRHGDVVTVVKLDRLARSSRDLHHGQCGRIAERYTAGETMAELARDYRVGETTIWRALQ